MAESELAFNDRDHVSLFEVVDRVLNKGVVIAGEVTISVADIELIRLGLQVMLAPTGKILEMVKVKALAAHSVSPALRGAAQTDLHPSED